MTGRFVAAVAIVFASVDANAPFAAAQAATATIRGAVVDESVAMIAGAQIKLVNVDTGLQRSLGAGADGTFVLSLLPPGRYRLTAQHDGFATSELNDVVVTVGDAIDIKIVLKIAALETTVAVSADAVRAATTPAVGTVVDRQFVEHLPLNGRSFQSLIAMTPGIVMTAASSSSPGQFSVNGQRSDANYFTLDGVSANVGVQSTAGLGPAGAGAAPALNAQGATNSLVSLDAMQEFRIQSSSYAPEFGRTAGGQISIVTRSGTNEFHGSVFEYFRDDALDASDYFVKRQRLAKPKEQQDDFGGVFGGPLQRNRMFVFVSHESIRLEQPRSSVTEVLSIASRLAAPAALKPLVEALPIPNGPDTADGLAQFSASYADPSALDTTSVRIDRTLGDSLTAFARYNHAPSEGTSRLGSFALASANTIGSVRNKLETLTAGTTWVIGPALSHELRVNWSKNAGTNFQTLDTFGGAIVPPASMLHPSFVPAGSTFRVNFGPANVFVDEGPNSDNAQRQLNIVNALLFVKGRHQLKFGIDYRRLLPIYDPVDYVQAYTFNGVAGATAGVAQVLTAASSTHNRRSHATNFSAYAQDAWTPTAALTVTYGMRWDVNPAPGLSDSDASITFASLDPVVVAPAGTPMFRTTYDNIAPRLGAAYRVSERSGRELVLRGGWGIFFDLASPAVMNNLSQTYPFTAIAVFDGVSLPADARVLAVPTIVPGAPASFLVASDPDLKSPYTHEWNIAAEQALGATSTLTVSYVGASGRRLLAQERYFNRSAQFPIITLGTNRGHSRYDALQMKFGRRLSRGLQALASYTLARSEDNISTDAIAALPLFTGDSEQDWGPSDFDVRQTGSAAFTYELPSRARGRVWNAITSRWSMDAVITARSALPVNVVTGVAYSAVSNALRPDVVQGAPLYLHDESVPGNRRFNRAAFVTPPLDATGNPLRQGTLPRNALRGFAMRQVDVAVRREIPLHGRMRMHVRAEAFNLFNQVNFGVPINILSNGLFGQATRTVASSLSGPGITGGGLSPLYQTGGPRSIQLALKFQF